LYSKVPNTRCPITRSRLFSVRSQNPFN
jgi:hypothetical protein